MKTIEEKIKELEKMYEDNGLVDIFYDYNLDVFVVNYGKGGDSMNSVYKNTDEFVKNRCKTNYGWKWAKCEQSRELLSLIKRQNKLKEKIYNLDTPMVFGRNIIIKNDEFNYRGLSCIRRTTNSPGWLGEKVEYGLGCLLDVEKDDITLFNYDDFLIMVDDILKDKHLSKYIKLNLVD